MNQQRKLIYAQRGDVLAGEDLRPKIEGMILDSVERNLASIESEDITPKDLRGTYLQMLLTPDEVLKNKFADIDLVKSFTERAISCYKGKEKLFGEETMREIERIILLRNVDRKWMEHLDAMEELKGDVGLNAYAQRNPVSEYRIIGSQMFDDMVEDVREETVRGVLTVMPKAQPMKREQVAKAQDPGMQRVLGVTGRMPRINPSAPCPCGSGKAFRFCHGATQKR